MICPTCGWDNVPGNEACAKCRQDLASFDRPAATCKIERSLMEDPISVLPLSPPILIPATATIRQAVETMITGNIGALLVVDDAGLLQGIISERDILKKVVGCGDDLADEPVTRFMTPRPEAVAANATLSYVLRKLDAGSYRHVPIVQDGRPVGVVSVRDMLRHLTRLCQ